MAFADAGGGDLDKLGGLLHGVDGGAAAVAHAGAHTAGHLVDDGHHGALVGHAAFDALGHQFVGIGVAGAGLLKIAVGTALLHGADAAHAPVAFVAAALVQDDFARRLFGAGEHAAHHHAAGTGGNGLGDVAAVADAAVGDQRHAGAAQGGGHAVNRHDLRHAHAGHNAGGANRARANADLDRIGARLHQGQSSGASGDVATHHIDVRVVLLDPAHPVDHALAVTVRRVHHDGVHTGAHQGFHALFGALAHPDRRAHAQLALGVASGVGETGLFGDVFHGDQALELKGVIDHQQALDLVLVEQHLGLGQRGAVGHGYQLVAPRHDFADRQVVAGLETQVTSGHDTDHFATVAHREARHTELLRQRHHLAHGMAGRNDHWVAQHTRFIALDLGHLGGLLLRREIFVHDADAALLGNGNRQPGFGDGVHRGRHQGEVQRNVAGKTGGKRGVLGQDLGVSWHQQHVVEGERFTNQAHV